MRALNGTAQALLARIEAGDFVPWAQLVYMALGTPEYLTTAGRAVTWDGHTWQPAGVTVEMIDEGIGDLNPLRIISPGVTPAQIAQALSGDLEGVDIYVYDALIDPDTGVVADAKRSWAGKMGAPSIVDSAAEASVVIECEHYGVRALRAKPLRYTDEAQRRLYAGDTALDRDPRTDAARLVWPAASFYHI